GISTGAMALVWGGYAFIFFSLVPATLLIFIIQGFDKNKFYINLVWTASSFVMMSIFSNRYPIISLLTSSYIIVIIIMVVHLVIFNTKLKKYFENGKLSRIPPQIVSFFIAVIVLFSLAFVIFGSANIYSRIGGVVNDLINPANSRLIQTVAENRQPFFPEWKSDFSLFGFLLFFVGSIYLFFNSVKSFRISERIILTASYALLIFSIVFSRYKADSVFNGTSNMSLFLYFSGFVVFLICVVFYYYKYWKNNELDKLKNIEFGFIVLLVYFLLCLVAARGAVRLIMMLVPPASIMIGYLAVGVFNEYRKVKEEIYKVIFVFFAALVIVLTLFAVYKFYTLSAGQASNYVPSGYTYQWQRAMEWVRENTQKNAVFAHWWDYGYWIQSIGKRASVLDGGNVISYWNHFMGRHVLTGTDDRAALEFLYAHNATHLLIDSTDIGKYSAFSLIGSDVNYDRSSNIPTFEKNNQLTKETKSSTVYVYEGGSYIDEDLLYEKEGVKIEVKSGRDGLGAVLIEENERGEVAGPPVGIFVVEGKQINIPIRYLFFNGRFVDFESGVDVGVYVYPRFDESSGGVNVDFNGALLYLSKRTVNSQLARLYLYKEDNPYFRLVYSEDDSAIAQLKKENPLFNFEIVQFRGLRGPIRIWEIKYPKDIKFKPEFLETSYPRELQKPR
ncbi:MAG: hypothetical protein AABX73_00235, partial [Nanoarchaeota archaeon]